MFLLWRKHASVIKMLQRAHREFCASRAGPPQCQGSRRIFLLLDTERPRNKSLVGAASPCAPRRWPDALKSRTLGSSILYFLAAARFSIVGSAPIWVVSLPAALEKAVMFPSLPRIQRVTRLCPGPSAAKVGHPKIVARAARGVYGMHAHAIGTHQAAVDTRSAVCVFGRHQHRCRGVTRQCSDTVLQPFTAGEQFHLFFRNVHVCQPQGLQHLLFSVLRVSQSSGQ